MRVLVIEDAKRTAEAVKTGLELHHYAVDIYSDIQNGTGAARDTSYDLILLDRRLSHTTDGIDLCRQIRAEGIATPVIMVTAHGEVADRIAGLEAGADDYLVKPFSIDELLARMEAILRRPKAYIDTTYRIADLELNATKHEARRNAILIDLTPKEYAILLCMMRNTSMVITKEFLVSQVWDESADILPATIESYISSLRKKVDNRFPDRPGMIETIWGIGYRLRSQGRDV